MVVAHLGSGRRSLMGVNGFEKKNRHREVPRVAVLTLVSGGLLR